MLLKKLQVHPFDMNAEQIDIDLILDKPKNFNPHAAKLMSRKDDANPDTTLAVRKNPQFLLTFISNDRNWREPLRNGYQRVRLSPASGKISTTNSMRVRLIQRKRSMTCYQCSRRSLFIETLWQRLRSSSKVVYACLTKATSNFWPHNRWRFKMKCLLYRCKLSLLVSNPCSPASPTWS